MNLNPEKCKINNSYESEPSSGSGSSLGENNDGPPSDDENLPLSKLLKPRQSDDYHGNDEELEMRTAKRKHFCIASPIVVTPLRNSGEKLVSSSEGSPFLGFTESPFGKLQRLMYAEHKQEKKHQPQQQQETLLTHLAAAATMPVIGCKAAGDGDVVKKPARFKELFTSYYDVIINENSCNAVDIQLSGESCKNDEGQKQQQQNCSNKHAATSSGIKTTDTASPNLSFNGKIKSLCKSSENVGEMTLQEEMSTSIRDFITKRLPVIAEDALNCSQEQLSESFVLRKYSNEKSPDLFADSDDDDADGAGAVAVAVVGENRDARVASKDQEMVKQTTANEECRKSDRFEQPTHEMLTKSNFLEDHEESEQQQQQQQGNDATTMDKANLFKNNCKREKEMLRRTRLCLAGLPPPPSMTMPEMDFLEVVMARKEEILKFLSPVKSNKKSESSITDDAAVNISSLLKPTHSLEETKAMPWRDILGVRQHGLCYNLSKSTEYNDYLSLSIVSRYVGAETATSFKSSPSSAKKRNQRMKLLMQSPGNRLSHLAKRRTMFSSAQLATTTNKSLGPQILIDKKKTRNKRKSTPKRMTPSSKKKRIPHKTPSSSARKRLFRCDFNKTEMPTRDAPRRALFQSPAKEIKPTAAAPKPLIKSKIATRVEKSKRALFSPEENDTQSESQSQSQSSTVFSIPSCHTQSQGSTTIGGFSYEKVKSLQQRCDSQILKRKRNLLDDELDADCQINKFFRGYGNGGGGGGGDVNNESFTARSLKIKSQSFCIGAGNSATSGGMKFGFNYGNSGGGSGSGSTTAIHRLPSSLLSSKFGGSSNAVGAGGVPAGGGGGVGDNRFMAATKMQRAHSEIVGGTHTTSSNLTENQRKKLLWAVSQALQEKNITPKHDSFKEYASVLARVVKSIFQEYYKKTSTSNSETLLRLAKKYVNNVISGRNAEDIYQKVKTKLEDSKRASTASLSTLQSFSVCSSIGGSMQNLFTGTENSIDSMNSMNSLSTTNSNSNNNHNTINSHDVVATDTTTNFLGCIAVDETACSNPQSDRKRLPIQSNPSLQNSSSKNNLNVLALRENLNVDVAEQRRSAQKNFTGKDQRNMSPYNANTSTSTSSATASAKRLGSTIKPQHVQSLLQSSAAKAKRQICFDS